MDIHYKNILEDLRHQRTLLLVLLLLEPDVLKKIITPQQKKDRSTERKQAILQL